MDKPTVYIETSIVSYLAARPSRDPVTARNQRLTHEWWNTHRHRDALFTSRLTLEEAEQGDPAMAARRVALLMPIPLLRVESFDLLLARSLERQIPLPPQARDDAVHIAAAATRGMAYLLTWDSKHIANPRLESRMRVILLAHGYPAPVLCTPRDLMEDGS